MRDWPFVVSGLGVDIDGAPGSVRHVRQRVRHGVRHQLIDSKRCAACAAYAHVMRARARARMHARMCARMHTAHTAQPRCDAVFWRTAWRTPCRTARRHRARG